MLVVTPSMDAGRSRGRQLWFNSIEGAGMK